jgi:hypothetical protein
MASQKLEDKVDGIVLVESSHPDMMSAYEPLLSEEPYEAMQEFVRSQPNHIDLIQTEASVRSKTDFNSIPLLVVSRGKPGHIDGLSPDENEKVDGAWSVLHLQHPPLYS